MLALRDRNSRVRAVVSVLAALLSGLAAEILSSTALASTPPSIESGSVIVYGPDQTFTTAPTLKAPDIESTSVMNLTSTDATLGAQIDTEGLAAIYWFKLWPASCSSNGIDCDELIPIWRSGGLLLGSFVPQTVSLDLVSAGVTLKPGAEYAYSLAAISVAGCVEAEPRKFTVLESQGATNTGGSPSGQPGTGGGPGTGPGGGPGSSTAGASVGGSGPGAGGASGPPLAPPIVGSSTKAGSTLVGQVTRHRKHKHRKPSALRHHKHRRPHTTAHAHRGG